MCRILFYLFHLLFLETINLACLRLHVVFINLLQGAQWEIFQLNRLQRFSDISRFQQAVGTSPRSFFQSFSLQGDIRAESHNTTNCRLDGHCLNLTFTPFLVHDEAASCTQAYHFALLPFAGQGRQQMNAALTPKLPSIWKGGCASKRLG